MPEKKDIYKWIKIAGMLSFIPPVLALGPFAGYLAGNFIVEKFGLKLYVTYLFIGLGFIASIKEVIRIVKLVVKIEKGNG